MTFAWPKNQPDVLRNLACAYCGISFDEVPLTKDHVIGRRFVPKGTLNQSWNVILRACSPCNGRKADLENDLSFLTMHPDAIGSFPTPDSVVRNDVQRKAKGDLHGEARKAVARSEKGLSFTAPLFPGPAGASVTFGYVSPPQPDRQRAFELARMQLIGFFYRLTFDRASQRGYYWLGDYVPVDIAPRSDWGNTTQRAFAEAVDGWENRLTCIQANGHFKASIRRHATSACWSWALEWNLNYRLIGFFGEPEVAAALIGSFPPPVVWRAPPNAEGIRTMREELSLPEEADKLFTLPPRPAA
jgi:hypothetical protein